MKQFLLISLFYCFCINFVFSQDWKDSIKYARKLYQNGEYEKALKVYQAVQYKKSNKIDISNELAQTAYKAQKFQEAEKNFSKNSSKPSNNQDKARTFHNLGNTKLKQKKYDEAISSYRESLRNNPNDEETRYNLAAAMKRQEEKKQQEKQENKNSPPPPSPSKEKKDNKNDKDLAQQSNMQRKKTERMLDELMKKEMETKKKLESKKGEATKSKSKKDW